MIRHKTLRVVERHRDRVVAHKSWLCCDGVCRLFGLLVECVIFSRLLFFFLRFVGNFIHVSLFLGSFLLVSSILKNSLRSFSNIFFDLPMLLLFTVCSNAHSESPLHRCVSLFCLVRSSSDVFHPVFLILFCSVHIVVCNACERGVAVLATSNACAVGVFRLCGQPSVASFVICRVFLFACFFSSSCIPFSLE